MSSDQSEEEEHDAVSKQIADYYRKYSLSQHLPKYFSGTSLSYMPPIVKEEELVPITQPIIIIDDTNSEGLIQSERPPLEPKLVSPTSSITSNRKLEWDNGADIGYSNYHSNPKLQKSHSLPILFGDTKTDKSPPTKLTTEIVTVISYPSGDDDYDKQIQSSSSSASYPAEAPIISSSSSVRTNIKPISTTSSSFTSTIAYLKSKIGTPEAESTPKFPPGIEIYPDTPFVPKIRKRKFINLCLTKPIVVECFDNHKKKSSDKKIQTTFTGGFSNKSIQTSNSLEVLTQQKKPEPKPIENQSIILITYDCDSDKRLCSSNCQTDADIASPCDSFEYYRQEKQNLPSTDSSKDIPLLGQLITENQSKSLIGDVDKSINLLQKLLKSKKYDPATKKRYVKKIVEKIVHSKYSEDSTTSSELFVPKKQDVEDIASSQPRQFSKFTVKTFSDEFLPGHESDIPKEETGSSLEKQTISSGSFQSWKDEKTTSEKLLEENQNGQGDHLLTFAKKERQHQLQWINDEISHLTKLRGLLEKKVQTTTVYTLSQHLHKSQSNPSKSQDNPRRYVIRTELSSGGSTSGVPQDYNLYDRTGKKCYCVSDFSKGESSGDGKVIGDIEVVSDDHTTCIKVKTKKGRGGKTEIFQPKPPALIGSGKYDTFPKSKAEEKGGSFTFEVPLNCTIADKVREIVNKYTKPSVDKFSKCKCICTCPKSSRTSETSCVTCCKCEDLLNEETQTTGDKKQIENVKCQTKPCGCCQKSVQTTIEDKTSSKEEKDTKSQKETLSGDQQIEKNTVIEKGKVDVKSQTKTCGCDQEVQTTVCTKDANCYCWRCQNTVTEKGKVENGKSQTTPNSGDQEVQTTVCTKDANCCSRRCSKYAIEKGKTENGKSKTTAHGGDKEVQTTICTKDASCCCRRCQNSVNKKEDGGDQEVQDFVNKSKKVGNVKCQTKACVKDASCCCRRCKNSSKDKQNVENAKSQTTACGCDQQVQTTEKSQRLPGCKTSENNKQQSENVKCQTKACDCDQQVQTTENTQCCRGCQASENNKQKSENVKCQTTVCDCNQQVQTSEESKCCRGCQASDKNWQNSGDVKCQTDVCSCEEAIQTNNTIETASSSSNTNDNNKGKEVKCQTDVCTKDASCGCYQSDNSTYSTERNSVENVENFTSSSTTSSSSSDSDASYSESLKSCHCCKRKNLSQKYLSSLKQKLCNQAYPAYPLCRPCYKQNLIGTYPVSAYTNPSHVCGCYTVVQTTTLNEIKKTINDLEAYEDCCTCVNPKKRSNSDHCKYCQGKLRRTSKSKNGIAYCLTFENGSFKKEKKSKKPHLEEIKIKIPVLHKKKHKDKENKRKKRNYDSEETSSSGIRKNTTLQEYLSQNRPEFVQDAEGRRHTVNNSRTHREEMSDQNKMLFLQKCLQECEKKSKHVFSGKEMKEITERHYRKLPEVQKKLNDNRDKQLRLASRLMANTFNKKLRENVLKGHPNLPINAKVVTM